MKVVITAASRQGATTEIAVRIAHVLEEARIDATVVTPDSLGSLSGYDAVILGSAVRYGRWLEPARRFVAEHRDELAVRPLWLFSSGPVGEVAGPDGEPQEATNLAAELHAVDHHVFAGRLSRNGLNIAERALTSVMHAPEGDFRPWAEIDAWAWGIARTLAERAAAPA